MLMKIRRIAEGAAFGVVLAVAISAEAIVNVIAG